MARLSQLLLVVTLGVAALMVGMVMLAAAPAGPAGPAGPAAAAVEAGPRLRASPGAAAPAGPAPAASRERRAAAAVPPAKQKFAENRDGREERRKNVIANVAFQDLESEEARLARKRIPGATTTNMLGRKTAHREPVTAEHRRFKTADRKDFLSSIGPGLTALGMEETLGADWDLYWGGQWPVEQFEDTFLSEALRGRAVQVGSVPGYEKFLGSKPALAALHAACLRLADERRFPVDECAFTMRGFSFARPKKSGPVEFPSDEEERAFFDFARSEGAKGRLAWVLKPKFGFMNMGIRMLLLDRKRHLSSAAAFRQWLDGSIRKGDFTAQQFVSDPLTYKKRKWDMRVWALVTSVDPLRVFVMDHGYPKISTVDFNLNKRTLHDQCMLITMPLGDGCKSANLVRPYPGTTSAGDFAKHLGFAGAPRPWRDVWRDVGREIVKPLLLERHETLSLEQRIEATGLHYRRFALLSPDVIITAAGKPIVEEINTNGFMVGDRYSGFWRAQQDTEDAMIVLGVNGYARAAYEAEVSARIGAFCAARAGGRCSEREAEALWALEDETRAAEGRPFTRVFPAMQGGWHEEAARKFDQAPPTALDELTWAYVRA